MTDALATVHRQDEQVSNLPEVGEPQRCRNLKRDGEADEPAVVIRDERIHATGREVLLQPAGRPRGVRGLAVVNAVEIEERCKGPDFVRRRRCQRPNIDALAGGRRLNVSVLSHSTRADLPARRSPIVASVVTRTFRSQSKHWSATTLPLGRTIAKRPWPVT